MNSLIDISKKQDNYKRKRSIYQTNRIRLERILYLNVTKRKRKIIVKILEKEPVKPNKKMKTTKALS